MTSETSQDLRSYRWQLHAAIERDLARGSRARRVQHRMLALGLPATTAAAAAATVLLTAGGASGPGVADAAILRHTADALTGPPGTILHEQAMVSLNGSAPQLYEVWLKLQSPYPYRVIKWGHEGTGSAPNGVPDDPAAEVRSLIQSGRATVDATTTYGGVPAYKLTISGASNKWLNGTAYVSTRDYYPLEIDTNGETIRYQTYEYLPSTPGNEALLSSRS
jgi:hypothetical protein